MGQSAGSFLSGGSAASNGGWQHHSGGNDAGDLPGSASGGGSRTKLSQEETSGVVAVLEYLISNFQHLEGGESSPLYGAGASPTHTLD